MDYKDRLKQRPSSEIATIANENGEKLSFETIEIFKLYREKIVHEDNLINFRTSWFIALQAFLFSAFAFSVGRENGAIPIASTFMFSLVGLFIAVFTLVSVIAADKAINKTGDKWSRPYVDEENDRVLKKGVRDIIDPMGLLPAIKGAGGSGWIAFFGSILSKGLPVVVAIFWLVFLMASSRNLDKCAPFDLRWLTCSM